MPSPRRHFGIVSLHSSLTYRALKAFLWLIRVHWIALFTFLFIFQVPLEKSEFDSWDVSEVLLQQGGGNREM